MSNLSHKSEEDNNSKVNEIKFSHAMINEFFMFILAIFFIYKRDVMPSYWGHLSIIEAISYGALGGIILYIILGSAYLTRNTFMDDLKKRLNALKSSFDVMTNWHLLAIALSAGVAEELLFREVLQNGIKDYIGEAGGILIASLAFGLAHFISLPYVIFTVVIGLTMGILYEYSGSLVLVMMIHGVYDFIALYIIRHKPHWLKLENISN